MEFDVEEIISQCIGLLGESNVVTEKGDLARYETATFKTSNQVIAAVKPQSREQVQQLVRLANQFKVSLYPLSTGQNWGYGSAVPTANNCMVMDLGLMTKIVDFNKDLAYVTLQPGVTQKQLYEFLLQQGGELWMDATGSSESCSIIGNTMERGFGHTPYGDHFANVSSMEVVLPSGAFFNTGFARYPNAKAAEVYHWGVGPYLDGLFSQSFFGIVTQMTIWLMPKPEYYQAFFCSVDKDDFGPMVDALRPLRLDGTLKSAMHLVNGDKVVSAFGQYPWQEMKGKTPLSREWMLSRIKQLDAKAWNASGALYGSRGEVACARKRLKQALSQVKSSKLKFLDDTLLKFARLIQTPYRIITGFDLENALDKTLPVYRLKQGVPSNSFIPSTYWRKKTLAPDMKDAHPDRDKCGLIWLAPIAPMTGEHAILLEKMVEKTLLVYGFEPALSMTLLTARCIDCVISITYDRENGEEEGRALACHDDLLHQLIELGYYPYRLSTHAMGKLPAPQPGYLEIIDKIKEALDPNGIIAPGRYQEKLPRD